MLSFVENRVSSGRDDWLYVGLLAAKALIPDEVGQWLVVPSPLVEEVRDEYYVSGRDTAVTSSKTMYRDWLVAWETAIFPGQVTQDLTKKRGSDSLIRDLLDYHRTFSGAYDLQNDALVMVAGQDLPVLPT